MHQPPVAEFVPTNDLERALQRAFTDSNAQVEFFRLLPEAEIYVPGHAVTEIATTRPAAAGDDQQAEEQQTLELQHWQRADASQVIPFFSSITALYQAAGQKQPFVQLSARSLFNMTRGETLYINPMLTYGREFTPQQIAILLDRNASASVLPATSASSGNSEHILPGGMPLLLSSLLSPPEALIRVLTDLFQQIKSVKSAFLCQIKEQADGQANLLLGIIADGNIEPIIEAAGKAATDVLNDEESIDICQLKEDEAGISHFIIAHIPPFYQRRWGSFLRDFQQTAI